MRSLLDNGFVTPNTKVNVEGGKAISYGSLVEDDHKYKELNMQQAFEASSNIAFAKQIVKSYDSNPNLHYNYIDGLGLNKSLKIHLFGAQPPIYLKPKNNLWSKSDLSAISRGYGISVTPLQMLTLYNAIANNGVMVNPFFVKKIIKSGQIIKEFEPEIINPQICKASTVKQLKNMLEGVVKNGTAYNPENQNLPYTFAGKTGTAIIQKGEDYFTEGKKAYRASWCGYFPAQKPKYSCFILITKPKGQMIYGSQLALPVFKDLANKIYATSFNTQKNIDDISPLPSNDLPLLVKAHKIEVKTALDQLGISSSIKNDSIDELASNWFTGVKKDNALELIPIINEPKKMPDVKGMSAKDALYLLECKGFKVNVSGLGKVVKQSIKPGSSYSRGVKVNLILG
jgi:cell division protein FtsI (penicillin-binding protein 3)